MRSVEQELADAFQFRVSGRALRALVTGTALECPVCHRQSALLLASPPGGVDPILLPHLDELPQGCKRDTTWALGTLRALARGEFELIAKEPDDFNSWECPCCPTRVNLCASLLGVELIMPLGLMEIEELIETSVNLWGFPSAALPESVIWRMLGVTNWTDPRKDNP